MRKPLIVLIHAGYWALCLSIISTVVSVFVPDSHYVSIGLIDAAYVFMPEGMAALVPGVITFYISYLLLFDRYFIKKKVLTLFFAVLLVSLATTLLTFAALALTWASSPKVYIQSPAGLFWGSLTLFTAITMIHAFLALVIKGFIRGYNDLRIKNELSRKNFEMEIALMKAQVNPHFLFNTINNIDALILSDAGKASEYLNKLSDILRFMLYETKADKIPLATELSYIEKYIDLQKIRTTNPSYIRYEVSVDVDDLMIGPMLFIPFIENAFKHAENKKVENAVNIRLVGGKKAIRFICENAYAQKTRLKPEHSGLGDDLIRRRLALLYPNRHTLETSDKDGIYKVNLLISP